MTICQRKVAQRVAEVGRRLNRVSTHDSLLGRAVDGWIRHRHEWTIQANVCLVKWVLKEGHAMPQLPTHANYDPFAKQKAQAKTGRIPIKVVAAETVKKPEWIRVKAG